MEKTAAALAAQSLLKEKRAALVGERLGHYQIVREIGRGGMGVVLSGDFVARHNRTKHDFDGCESGKYWFISFRKIRCDAFGWT
jgi:hypothetical protein